MQRKHPFARHLLDAKNTIIVYFHFFIGNCDVHTTFMIDSFCIPEKRSFYKIITNNFIVIISTTVSIPFDNYSAIFSALKHITITFL